MKSDIPGKRPLNRPAEIDKAITTAAEAESASTPIDEDVEATPDSNSLGAESLFGAASNSVQILDFESPNPIVSYQNEVYSCTWSDMIGTNMFFTPQTDPWSESEEPVKLLGMSRVRLIGHKAKVTAKQDPNATDKTFMFKGTRAAPNNSHSNNALKRQGNFLERLMDAKKAKGDSDLVRTIIPDQSRRPTPLASISDPEASAHRQEIDQLNRLVVRGDANALARLEDIYNGEAGKGSACLRQSDAQ